MILGQAMEGDPAVIVVCLPVGDERADGSTGPGAGGLPLLNTWFPYLLSTDHPIADDMLV